jgi:putative membrane-bound dehydrogenase-like protein
MVLWLLATGSSGFAGEQILNGSRFVLPDGLELSVAAAPPLANRPICFDFDEQGRLYVAESSGSNDKVQKQLEDRPHRVLRLEDANGDGQFDRRTVFADQMMFPEGALWHQGSLYVAAPPSIWKLTDDNGDGVADRREEWFAGGTLTGCANDLHGPYAGPDGWLYWCKGAFAEQRFERPGRPPLVTRAAHIFRRSPAGDLIEPVMTGGMDNPVEVAFSPGGERFFTTTFLQQPAGGLRDGIIHAIYGGAYGKQHGVLDGHVRTGELLPPLTHLGAAAPSGLARLDSDQLGPGFQDSLVATLFNLRKVTRHELVSSGGTYTTRDSDLLVCDSLDFHPTDALEDADGSLLIADTGGWYKLCCPTSQLSKPELLGAIYRIRRTGVQPPADAWGLKLNWSAPSAELVKLLEDPRQRVRQRALDVLANQQASAALEGALRNSPKPAARTLAAWGLCRIGNDFAFAALRSALKDPDENVRHAAAHALGLHRDRASVAGLIELLSRGTPGARRAAAEALGRIGERSAVPPLVSAAAREDVDRALQHSLIYALIEIDDPAATRAGPAAENAAARAAALIALDQMPGGGLTAAEVSLRLASGDPGLRSAARWVAGQHPEWAGDFSSAFASALEEGNALRLEELRPLFQQLLTSPALEQFAAERLAASSDPSRQWLLETMSAAGLKSLPDCWQPALAKLLVQGTDVAGIMSLLAQVKPAQVSEELQTPLRQLARGEHLPAAPRLTALALISGPRQPLDPQALQLVIVHLHKSQPASLRSAAADVLGQSRLAPPQLDLLLAALPDVGPLELERVAGCLIRSTSAADVQKVLDRLADAPALESLPKDKLKKLLASHGAAAQQAADAAYRKVELSQSQQRSKLDELLSALPPGEIRRGQLVFNSEKTSCKACHAMGYLGGQIGPDLTRVGKIRSERDLLEAVLFPSASFVRSYEPMTVVTADGQVFNGLMKEEAGGVIITTTDRKQIRIAREEIDQIVPGTVSIMPAGLDKQMTPQELADLIAFLKSSQ